MAGKIPVELVDEVGLYVSERKVYPREQGGFFQTLRKAAVFWLLGMYYGFAWLQWDDRQAVLWDLPARKFYVFGLVFWPQDFLYLALLLIMAGLSLFFFTAVAGRLWCGYACPQTVWTDLYIYVERLFEGDRNARMRLDAAPMSFNKLWRKAGKHAVWIGTAFGTGGAWIFYFHDAPDLIPELVAMIIAETRGIASLTNDETGQADVVVPFQALERPGRNDPCTCGSGQPAVCTQIPGRSA